MTIIEYMLPHVSQITGNTIIFSTGQQTENFKIS